MLHQCRNGLLFCLLLLVLRAASQNSSGALQQPPYIFRHLDNTNGLVSNQVFAMAQDKKGYMWIGTTRGLQRYDGQRFTNYADTGTAMNGPLAVSGIYPDDANSRLLYMKSLTVIKQRKQPGKDAAWVYPAKEWSDAESIVYTDQQHKTWRLQYYHNSTLQNMAGVPEGLALVTETGNRPPYFAFFVHDKKHGKTWVLGFEHGLLLFNDARRQVFGYGDTASHEPLLAIASRDPLFIGKIRMDGHGNLWVLTWSDILYRYNTDKGSLHQYSVAAVAEKRPGGNTTTFATAMLPDDHGNCWMATAYAGLLQYHYEDDSFTVISSQPGNNSSLQYNQEIYALFQDREHNIWIGSDKGISIFNPYQQYSSAISYNTAAHREITCAIKTNDGGLMVGLMGGGIIAYNKELRNTGNYVFNGKDENRIWCLLQTSNGNVLAGCQHGYTQELNEKHAIVKTMHPAELENSTVRAMQEDSSGNIYYGLHNGKLVTWNRQQDTFSSFEDRLLPAGFQISPVLAIHFDKHGICRVGTENGLAEFDAKTHCFTALYKPALQMPATIQSIVQYNDSTLLIGMQNAGIYFFNTRKNLFTRLPVNTGQAFWSAQTVGLDEQRNIWFTTDYAIYRYNEHTKELISFSPHRQVTGASFLPGNFIQAAADNWFTCTNSEMIRFNPSYISSWQHTASAVSITGIKVMDQPLFTDSLLAAGKPIQLTYRNNFLTIEFSNLQFSGVLDTKYYYRLTGIDKDWVRAGAATASYTNLPPGQYHFAVTTGSPGNTKDLASLDITIASPYWETGWFRLLCTVLAVLLLFYIAAWYIRNIRNEAALKTQIANTEMMALRAQMNPHFIFNCINSIDALIQCDDKYNATMYLNKFAKLIRNILDSSKQQTIGLRKDLETLQLYLELERLRNSNKFVAEIKTDDAVFKNDCKVPPLIVQPYVENAILHGLRNRPGNNGRLTIDVYRDNDRLVYVIEDNGIGRKAAANTSHKYRSYGMEMSRDRLKLFNLQEEIPVVITDLEENGQASGTRVQVSLKIK